MFVIHGQSGSFDAIVATSSLQKAAFHFRRMTQSGLHPIVKDEQGRPCSLRSPQTVRPAGVLSAHA